MKHLFVLLLAVLFPLTALAQPSGCSGEAGLSGRDDILLCEDWSSSTWWQNGYKNDGALNSPSAASGPDNTSVQSNCFQAGPCLKVTINSCAQGGGGGMLAHHRPIPGNPDEVWLRYYLRLAPNFSARNFVVGSCGTESESGGKFPGLADPTTDADPQGQCGNGGAASDGINCWSGRLKFDNCSRSGSNICTAPGTTGSSTRLGWYWYLPPAQINVTNQVMGPFDNNSYSPDGGGHTCSSTTGVASNGSDATSCGKGAAGIPHGVWVRVELHVKMNNIGQQNGIAEAWIDGVLKYRKTNVEYRYSGHRGLYVRNVWLDVHFGGEGVGPASPSAIYLARLAVCGKARCGAFKSAGTFNSSPFQVRVQ